MFKRAHNKFGHAGLSKSVALALTGIMGLGASVPAFAQQAAAPTYDPNQFDRRFNSDQNERSLAARTRIPMPQTTPAQAPAADTRPLFVLRHIVIAGAT